MNSFIGIRFKKETAKRFQKFQRHTSNHILKRWQPCLIFSSIMKFLQKKKFGPTGRTIEATIKKRINAVIAIMKDVEKTQTKPTAAMIASLFQVQEPTKKA